MMTPHPYADALRCIASGDETVYLQYERWCEGHLEWQPFDNNDDFLGSLSMLNDPFNPEQIRPAGARRVEGYIDQDAVAWLKAQIHSEIAQRILSLVERDK